MSNHYVDRQEYELNTWLLDKVHRDCNSVIVTNDDLARWIRQDFPDYRLDASVIKNIKTNRKIDEAMELYDSVVLPMRLNEDFEFLAKVKAVNFSVRSRSRSVIYWVWWIFRCNPISILAFTVSNCYEHVRAA